MAVSNYNSDKTKAIVLCTTPINDHTQFVHFYTEQRGRITCRVPLSSRGRRASQMRTLMTPMTLLELVLKPGHGEILLIAEASLIRSPYMLTMTHPEKAAQLMYMAELIHHVVRPLEQEPDLQFWHFILHSMEVLEQCESGYSIFHLVFTCQLISQLGFSIDASAYQTGHLFDLTEGVFTPGPVLHPYYLTADSAQWLHRMLLVDYDHLDSLPMTHEQRKVMLGILLAFINQHLPEVGKINSAEML